MLRYSRFDLLGVFDGLRACGYSVLDDRERERCIVDSVTMTYQEADLLHRRVVTLSELSRLGRHAVAFEDA